MWPRCADALVRGGIQKVCSIVAFTLPTFGTTISAAELNVNVQLDHSQIYYRRLDVV